MAIFQLLTVAAVSALLFSGQVMAYQYGYYAPAGYNAPQGYYQPYAGGPYPYYRASFRYPSQPAYNQATASRSPRSSGNNAYTPGMSAAEQTSRSEKVKSAVASTTGMRVLDLSDKKQQFISRLLPYIEQENRRLTALRARVEQMLAPFEHDKVVAESVRQQITGLANKYRVNGNPLENKAARDELLRKIDIIPASMALAQAANESAWGESRFAREANNLYGIWTYDENKGLKPLDREEGKTHLIRIFDDIGDSVRYYMYTLNSHPAYDELRNIRQQLRERNQFVDGHALAAGLERYSAKGQRYIDLIQELIEQNEWAQLDTGDQPA
jgi:Bax protein